MNDNFTCPICTCTIIAFNSESVIVGVCAFCRDTITPSYIPISQRDQFIRLYLKEKTMSKAFTLPSEYGRDICNMCNQFKITFVYNTFS